MDPHTKWLYEDYWEVLRMVMASISVQDASATCASVIWVAYLVLVVTADLAFPAELEFHYTTSPVKPASAVRQISNPTYTSVS